MILSVFVFLWVFLLNYAMSLCDDVTGRMVLTETVLEERRIPSEERKIWERKDSKETVGFGGQKFHIRIRQNGKKVKGQIENGKFLSEVEMECFFPAEEWRRRQSLTEAGWCEDHES